MFHNEEGKKDDDIDKNKKQTKFKEILQKIKANNITGSLYFLERTVEKFYSNYCRLRLNYIGVQQFILDFKESEEDAAQIARLGLGFIRTYLESVVSFCRKIKKFCPDLPYEFKLDCELELLTEITTRCNGISMRINELSQSLMHEAIDLFVKYTSVRTKKNRQQKHLVDLSTFPDINDIDEDMNTLHMKIKRLKFYHCEQYLTILKDMPAKYGEHMDDVSSLNIALSELREKLRQYEEAFALKATFFKTLLKLSNVDIRHVIQTELQDRGSEFYERLNTPTNEDNEIEELIRLLINNEG